MITAINSASTQNHTALKNRARAQGQNFGKIIFHEDSFKTVQNMAKDEFEKVTAKLSREISNVTANTDVSEIKTPYMDFLKGGKIIKDAISLLKAGKELTVENMTPYMEMTRGKLEPRQKVAAATGAIKEVTDFYELFGKDDSPFDVCIGAKCITQNEVPPRFNASNKKLGIGVFDDSSNFNVAGIVQKTKAALGEIDEKKRTLEGKLYNLRDNLHLLSEKF